LEGSLLLESVGQHLDPIARVQLQKNRRILKGILGRRRGGSTITRRPMRFVKDANRGGSEHLNSGKELRRLVQREIEKEGRAYLEGKKGNLPEGSCFREKRSSMRVGNYGIFYRGGGSVTRREREVMNTDGG